MAVMGYDGVEAVNALNTAVENDVELQEIFKRANDEVANAFSDKGSIVSGDLGKACAGVWGNGSRDFFSKELMRRTNSFLMDKVLPIIIIEQRLSSD